MDTIARLRVSARSLDQYAKFLLAVISIKGRPAEFREDRAFKVLCLHDRELTIPHFGTALLYVCERYPEPDLASGDVKRRAVIRLQALEILRQNRIPDEFNRLTLRQEERFLFGHEPTLIDLAVIAVTPDNDERFGRIHRSFNNVAERSQLAAAR